jgi:hypothetical protein
MNKNKVKLKYVLNLWKHLPQYPTKEDIIYELSVFLIKDGRPNGEFSPQTFKSVFGTNWEKSHGDVIDEMISSKDFDESQKSTETKKWYKIRNNIYYTK